MAKTMKTLALVLAVIVLAAMCAAGISGSPDEAEVFTATWPAVVSDLVWTFDGEESRTGTPSAAYDGEEHGVDLELWEGLTTVRSGVFSARDAGEYTAVMVLSYDEISPDEPETYTISKTWKIEKAESTCTPVWDYDGAFVYDGQEKEVLVTGAQDGTVITYTGNTAVNAGAYTATAVLSHKNYSEPSVEPLNWEIIRKTYDMSGVKWNHDGTAFTYDGKEKEVVLTGVPEGVTIGYTDNTAAEPGTYTAKAVITGWNDPKHYGEPSFPEGFEAALKWEIAKGSEKKTAQDPVTSIDDPALADPVKQAINRKIQLIREMKKKGLGDSLKTAISDETLGKESFTFGKDGDEADKALKSEGSIALRAKELIMIGKDNVKKSDNGIGIGTLPLNIAEDAKSNEHTLVNYEPTKDNGMLTLKISVGDSWKADSPGNKYKTKVLRRDKDEGKEQEMPGELNWKIGEEFRVKPSERIREF